ncbi:MAG TPA: DUF58 domain-containing protein [Thermoanaerobaculia bacterium]|nr:DUF58 domain-containing protein [Thermoanaerobaculia bacterium]
MDFEFNGVVRVTRVGATYLFATMVLAVAAVNTGNNALYIAVSLMLGCLLLSGLASKGGLKHLEIEIGGIDEAWAGRAAHGTLRIVNRSRIWNVRDVVLTSESFATPVLVPIAQRGADLRVEASFLFTRRGLAHVSAIDSYTRYPFGFFLKKRRLRVSSDVVVFPRILQDDATVESYSHVEGDRTMSGRPGMGTDLHALREYAAGDSLRQVHWRKSASIGRWIVKQPEAEAGESVHVVVDPYKPRATTDEQFEQMVSEAATFIARAAERELDVTLSLPRVTVRTRAGEGAAPLYRALALLEPAYEPVHLMLGRDSILFSAAPRERERQLA